MRLHVLAPQHVIPSLAMSSCAFGTKARRFGPMLKQFGYHVTLYCAGEPDNPEGWDDVVSVVSAEEQRGLLGFDPLQPGPAFVGNAANVGSPLYKLFNERLAKILESNVSGDDQVCATFGHAHKDALSSDGFGSSNRLWHEHTVESGIGYPTCFAPYRIYESQAYRHWHLGKEQRGPWLSEWVIPNYFDVADWPLRTADLKTGYVLYFGRLIDDKGLREFVEIAKQRPDLEFVICGQGEPGPYLQFPNIRYHEPVHGMDRATLIHGARCVLMPTKYVEPFGGVSIETMLTGTPCLTSDHSVFTETIPDELRCRTVGDWLAAIERASDSVPSVIRAKAKQKYSLTAVGAMYDKVFQIIPAMRRGGFYV